jgi:thiamine biosynthesis lipoprotein
MDSPGLTRRAFFRAPRASQPTAADYLVRVHREVMACRFEVVIPGEAGEQIPHAQAALDEADRLEQLMTIFRESSELSRINAAAHERPVPAGPELFGLLDACASLHDSTGGAFDITSTPLSRTWGFLRREGRLPTDAELAEARALVGMHLVELDAEAMSVHFRRPGVALNLGAIGKGFALDRLAEFLRRRGVRQALLSAGASSVLGIGGTLRPWEVHLRSMTTGGRLARLRVAFGAIGTSGAGEQFFEVEGVRYGHVIDPRSGWPATGVVSASVVTRSAARADALSTAFFIGGISLAKQYCADHPNVLAILTPDDEERRPVVFGSFHGASVELI